MPDSDPRYRYVHSIWAAGHLNCFAEIFDIIPKSIVCKDLGINYGRFAKKTNKPGLMTFNDVLRLSDLLHIEQKALAAMVLDQILAAKGNKSK
jgi:hypothetical protein